MTDVIQPEEIPVPKADCDAIETAATDLKNDGSAVAQIGQDIISSWDGLASVYSAPESETLLSAIDPVATTGDDFNDAVSTVGDALRTFAEEARPLKKRLQVLKTQAEEFQSDIADDEDWREDEGKVNELNTLNNEILATVAEYQRAERECANTITNLFGGTTFVGTEAGARPELDKGEKSYGYAGTPQNIATPWGVPQEHDTSIFEDISSALSNYSRDDFEEDLGFVGSTTGIGVAIGAGIGSVVPGAGTGVGGTLGGMIGLSAGAQYLLYEDIYNYFNSQGPQAPNSSEEEGAWGASDNHDNDFFADIKSSVTSYSSEDFKSDVGFVGVTTGLGAAVGAGAGSIIPGAGTAAGGALGGVVGLSGGVQYLVYEDIYEYFNS